MSRFTYQKTYDIASPGRVWGAQSDLLVKPYINKSPGDKEQWTLGIPATPSANTIYAVSVNGNRTAVDSGDSPTQATLQEQLLNAFVSLLSLNGTFTNNPAINVYVEAEISGTDILLTAKKYEQEDLYIAVEGTGLTATQTTPKSLPASIGFGLILVAVAGDWEGAMLPQAASDRVLGVSLNPYDIEKDAFGPLGKASFVPEDPMDILTRTNGAEGVWVQAKEDDLVPGDPLYVSYDAASRGKATKNATNAIDISSFASIQRPISNVNTNQLITLVQFNVV